MTRQLRFYADRSIRSVCDVPDSGNRARKAKRRLYGGFLPETLRRLIPILRTNRAARDPYPVDGNIHSRREWDGSNTPLAFILLPGLIGAFFLYGLLRLQYLLPGGPDTSYLSTPLTPDLSANTAISFSTTTTWQAYGGETTMKYWTQLIGLAGQNFMAGDAST